MNFYKYVSDLEANGEGGVLCTIVSSHGSTPRHTGSKILLYPDGKFIGSVGGGEIESRIIAEAKDAFLSGKSKILNYSLVKPQEGDPGICGGQVEVYVEPILPKPKLIVIGAGHVGKALAHLATWLEYNVLVSDDRPEFCTPEMVPDANGYYPIQMAEIPNHIKITPHTYLVLTTRGSKIDVEGLEPLLETDAAYIGIIGSKRRWALTRKTLLEKGVPEEKLNRIHSPIGLELNAETPEQIAVSIMAEIMMLQHHGTGKIMKV
jgi:xanthine dehydrogenase accessory factor